MITTQFLSNADIFCVFENKLLKCQFIQWLPLRTSVSAMHSVNQDSE